MYTAVLLSGGVGSRMNHSIPKQYMLLAGKPVIMHTLEKLDMIDEIKEIVVVCAEEFRQYIEMIITQYGIMKPIQFANAGATRQESVKSGLEFVKTDSVIIHEVARPFVKTEDFRRLIECDDENVILGAPINYTVIKGDECVKELLTRSELINVQLPQKFNTELLKSAHSMAEKEGTSFTEDAGLVFYYNKNVKIKIIDGTDYNIKLTTPMDMIIGESIYQEFFLRRV